MILRELGAYWFNNSSPTNLESRICARYTNVVVLFFASLFTHITVAKRRSGAARLHVGSPPHPPGCMWLCAHTVPCTALSLRSSLACSVGGACR